MEKRYWYMKIRATNVMKYNMSYPYAYAWKYVILWSNHKERIADNLIKMIDRYYDTLANRESPNIIYSVLLFIGQPLKYNVRYTQTRQYEVTSLIL